jgi:hypothetical protein
MRCTSESDACPVMVIWFALHPISASRRAVALRKPCADTSGQSAALQSSRNQFPKPAGVYGLLDNHIIAIGEDVLALAVAVREL